jgi:hypothetical protein
MKRTSAAAIKAFFISLAIAALINGFVVAYAQSGDLANCARIREVSGGCGRNSSVQRYTLTICTRTGRCGRPFGSIRKKATTTQTMPLPKVARFLSAAGAAAPALLLSAAKC